MSHIENIMTRSSMLHVPLFRFALLELARALQDGTFHLYSNTTSICPDPSMSRAIAQQPCSFIIGKFEAVTVA